MPVVLGAESGMEVGVETDGAIGNRRHIGQLFELLDEPDQIER